MAVDDQSVPTPAALLSRMKATGVVQDDIAQALHVDQSTVSRWLRGTRAIPASRALQISSLIDGIEAGRLGPLEAQLLFPDVYRDGPSQAEVERIARLAAKVDRTLGKLILATLGLRAEDKAELVRIAHRMRKGLTEESGQAGVRDGAKVTYLDANALYGGLEVQAADSGDDPVGTTVGKRVGRPSPEIEPDEHA